jgi:tetratricopeptide (TPR) repeat protein
VTAEALVARGVRLFEGHKMRPGLADLEAAVALDPELPEAQAALAAALLRSGEFERAALGFEHVVGEKLTSGLATGSIEASEVDPAIDREAIYGLAICRAQLGLHREADRLYRIYADLVGVTEPAAAKAYCRLAEMFEASGVSWGNAEAEMAKAHAIDPAIETKDLLIGFPDLASLPRFEPYTWPIELSPDPPDSMPELDGLPVLLRWVKPGHPAEGITTVDLLVDSTGRVSDVHIIESLGSDCSVDVSTTVAAMQWLFEPAVADDAPQPAWIRLGVIYHAAPLASTESL